MPKHDRMRYRLEKMARRRPPKDQPVVTIAYYGPDDKHASKVVAAVVPPDGEVTVLERWLSDDEDVRYIPAINAEILAFIAANGVEHVVVTDYIIGCPHEEGIDYPRGEECPQCPFWHGIDRWTGRPVAQKSPSMAGTRGAGFPSADMGSPSPTHPRPKR